jgi:hypothetical protein
MLSNDLKEAKELKRHIHRIFNERLKCNMHHRCTEMFFFLFSNKSVSLFISHSHSPFYAASRIEYLKVTIHLKTAAEHAI